MFQTYWNTLAFSPFVPGQTFSKIDSLLWILPYYFYISPKSPGFTKIRQYRQSGAQNRGFSAIGDLSPGPNSYRQLYVQNRGFGDISPEMATLSVLLLFVYILYYWCRNIYGDILETLSKKHM